MKFKKSGIAAFFLLIAIFFIFESHTEAAVKIPEEVRIGLYFKDASKHMDTAVSSFVINAQKGLQIGYFKDKNFIVLYEEHFPNNITVRKDTYYCKSGDVLREYDPGTNTLPNGEKIGPYHVQIGESFNDYNALLAQLSIIRGKGVNAYPAYTDTWRIWTGFYTDPDTAQQDISNIMQKLGEGAYSVVSPSADRIVVLTSKNEVAMIFGSPEGYLQIRPKPENDPYIFSINNTTYRGRIEVRRNQGSDMTVINILPLEEYLYGVVPYEIGAGSPMEALKAQAVVARTYTINNIGKFSKLGFDLCTTTLCQVYRGTAGETKNTNKAVDDTKGKVVTYNGNPAQVFYFASSGGRTEDVKNVWGSDIPYLKSVEDKYESGTSPYYNWEAICTADELKNFFAGMGKDLGDILGMEIKKVSEAGRVVELAIKGSKGELVLMREGCRFDLSRIRSQWYTISTDADLKVIGKDLKVTTVQPAGQKVITANGIKEIKAQKNSSITVVGAGNKKITVPSIPTKYVFVGRGWGHAVGMSQEGAKGMALAGFKYDSILQHYFPGTKVE
ncbi:MAG TPA: SpoIID/LytB domain-containing protein [Clostridiaceae bacterium]|nr:SpoIID/LytB domain-containing protein [Clostridiaceae bacterium]